MTTNTIVLIAAIAVVAILVLAAIAWVARNKRTEHHRAEASEIRDAATAQGHQVGRREALADETAARARVAIAEADAQSAHAAGLQHQAEERRSGAETARNEVNEQFQRADTLDPDIRGDDTSGPDHTETRRTG